MANNQGYYGVSLMGYQDTLLANNGNQIYANSYIDGTWYISPLPRMRDAIDVSGLRDFADSELMHARSDFIFGQYARAWFQRVDLRVKDSGYITANGKSAALSPFKP